MVITSGTGTGKTLAYLLPALHHLFQYKDRTSGGSPRFKLTKENEEAMFLNPEEIYYNNQKEGPKRLSFSRGGGSDTEPKGAIILSHSKELLSQVYA